MQAQLLNWYRKRRTPLWVIIGILLLYTVTGFFIAPLVIKHLIATRVSDLLQRKVAVTRVHLNPYTLSISFDGLSIAGENDTPLLSVGRIAINAQLSSLFRRAVVIKTIDINDPVAHVVREKTGLFNFSHLLPAQPSPQRSEKSAGEESSVRFILGHLGLSGGQIAFEDQAAAAPFATRWEQIHLSLHKMDTQRGAQPARFEFGATTKAGTKLGIDGKGTAVPFSVRADVKLMKATIADYAPYYQSSFRGKVASGTLSLAGTAEWNSTAQRIRSIGITIDNLKVDKNSGDPLAAIAELAVRGAAVDFKDRIVDTGTISTQDGKISIERTADGRLDLLDQLSPSTPPADATVNTAKAPTDTKWQVSLKSFRMDKYTLTATDHQPPEAAHFELHHISASAQGLGTREGTLGKVSLKFNWFDKGTFSANGELSLAPLGGTLRVDAADWDVRPAQTYITRFAHLMVDSGTADTQGTLRILPRKDLAPDIRYDGQIAVNSFQSTDAGTSRNFMTWKSLFVSGLKLATAEPKVSIGKVALTDFSTRIIVHPDAGTNISDIFGSATNRPTAENKQQLTEAKGDTAKKSSSAPPTQAATGSNGNEQPADIRIDAVTLQGGQVEFRDYHIQPHVQATLSEVGGSIKGLASRGTKNAEVLLRGKTPAGIPFEISGEVNPLLKPPFLNLKMLFSGIDLSRYTPYSGKYLGYELNKGQLSLHLAYHLENNHLVGKNKVEINQLLFGNSVKSDQATTLPVKLVVALLKDAQGNIDLDLPVQGDLDNPQFSLGGAILTVLRNLVTDIVSSPFKLLGSLFGGGEELQYLPFDPGYARITEAGRKKLDILSKALHARPALTLEIQGQANPDGDGSALREMRFELELKKAKQKQLKHAEPLENIALSAGSGRPRSHNSTRPPLFPNHATSRAVPKSSTQRKWRSCWLQTSR